MNLHMSGGGDAMRPFTTTRAVGGGGSPVADGVPTHAPQGGISSGAWEPNPTGTQMHQ